MEIMDKYTRLFDIIRYQNANYSQPAALANKVNGKWKTYSSAEVIQIMDQVSLGLLSLGLKPGDKVANISQNRPEWNFIDLGVMQMGAIHVPIYPTITDADYKFILNHAEVSVIFVANSELYSRIKNMQADLPLVKEIYTYDIVDGAKHWQEVVKMANVDLESTLRSYTEQVQSTDLATLIYTSGTTGTPKGVMLSHENIIANVKGSIERVPAAVGDKALSFLPLCHIYERMITYLYTARGIQIYYAESMETIADNLKEIQPQVFATVPRLLEKVYDKIVAKGYDLTGIKKNLFFWALNLGLKYEFNKDMGFWYDFQLKLANKIIFSKWREALGNNIKAIVSGAAALQPRLARVFWAAGIPVVEGYGLTETSPVIAVGYIATKQLEVGTVGPVLNNLEVKIAEDGEILVKGPSIMMGYYKAPDLTAEVIDADGWLHTGDIGEITKDNYLKITDRKKEIFKTSGGKYIAPQSMENKFKESLLIEQIMVLGENQKYPAAFIVPSWDNLKSWCSRKNIEYTTDAEIIKNAEVIQKFQEEIDTYNQGFGQWERIKKFEIMPNSWGIESGEMTPTLKLKRKIILNKYSEQFSRLYPSA